MQTAKTQLYQVALVGRPNVGKSTLFNRLVNARKAVVSEKAGTTRDRLKQVVKFGNQSALLVDMAGIEPALTNKTEISLGMQRQVSQALADAAVLIWVVDALTGVTIADQRVAELLRRLKKPVIVVVNKTDHPNHQTNQYEFAQFGFSNLITVSAIHNLGIQAIHEAVESELQQLPKLEANSTLEDVEDQELRLAILGRPNVGKSTLLNALAEEERAVVSPISGTTRDAVDTLIPAEQFFPGVFTKFKQVRIIDTAGIRQRGKMGHEVEAWSVLRSLDSLDQAQVALLVLDAMEGLTHQDLIVSQKILTAGKPLILIVNKWDLFLQDKQVIAATPEALVAQENFQTQLLSRAPFLAWVPVLFLSATTGLHLSYLGKLINRVYVAWSQLPKQSEVDELVEVLKKMPRLRDLTKITVERAQPPVFKVYIQSNQLPHFSTRRSVESALRDALNLGPTPMKLWFELSNARA